MTRGARGARTAVPFGDELRDLLGEPRRARELASSPRSRVWRVDLPDHGPAVVKQLVGGNGAAGRYAREVAALRLAGDAAPQVVPRLLGTEDRARLLVLERLEHGRPAEGWQVGYAAALARLHAAGQAAPRRRSSATPVTAAATAASADPASEASVTDDLLTEEPVTEVVVTEDLMTEASADEGALPRWAAPTRTDIDSFLALADTLGAPPVPLVAKAVEDKDGDDTSLDGLGRLCGQMADRMTSRWPRLGPVPALRPDDSA
ncbi:hypothetical protein [Streptomyces sp. NRRL F-5135]|uniref:hypothetical protein n=1 Tax=Streptomyces sp. NRRL F-5135 TaxID=1463858 RepID=UPI00068983A0|nr:hypothetical protein [Streptomyces sp. NRRL F-5135]